ncbi:uncharacterized protein LOC134848045 [Symsagittifera roscoffensis]|uniref:uncharacterized protein LOC134848045 n=1 Tax=Symsagittifera roscoffensis TaxID=84072 RepID=UPI00307CC1C9
MAPSNTKLVKYVVCCVAAVLMVVACIMCMMGHAQGIVSVADGSITMGLWTVGTNGGSRTYDLNFGVKADMGLIPTSIKTALLLDDSSFQRRVNSARVFLLFSHFSSVVVFFFFVMFTLDILKDKKGAAGLVGVNLIHMLLLVIACACMQSGLNKISAVDHLEWSGALIWTGFALSLFCLLMSLVGTVADMNTPHDSYDVDEGRDTNTATTNPDTEQATTQFGQAVEAE